MKNLMTLWIGLSLSFCSFGQLAFTDGIIINKSSEAPTPAGMESVDIDGDGDEDLLIAARGKLFWYENLNSSDELSDPKVFFTDFTVATFIRSGDFDGDGDVDVVVGSNNEMWWHQNEDGQGNFGAKILIASGLDSPRIPAIADINGDGFLDIVLPVHDLNRVSWYENTDGLGSFTAHTIASSLQRASSVSIADLDQDGDMDVVATSGIANSSTGIVVWYENTDGTGNFSSADIISTNFAILNPHVVVTADMDGDGDLDIITGSQSSAQSPFGFRLAWFENEGNGNFGTYQQIDFLTVAIRSLRAADLDADGDQDLVLGGSWYDENQLKWYKNTNGTGDFDEGTLISSTTDLPVEVVAADLNEDGHLDIVSASSSDNKIALFNNSGDNGNFEDPIIITTSDVKTPRYSCSSDLNLDGHKDILVYSPTDEKIGWFDNENGNADFSDFKLIDEVGPSLRTACAVNLDSDQDEDILFSRAIGVAGDAIFWIKNINQGSSFSQNVYIGQADEHQAIDYDGDGDLDIVAIHNDILHTVGWYTNNGQGGFSTFKSLFFHSNDELSVLKVGDMDGDGRLDIVYRYDGDLVWRKQNTSGSFSSPKFITTGFIHSSEILDMDLDGKADLFIRESNIRHYKYNPLLDDLSLISTTSSPIFKLKFVDVDGDSDKDILSVVNNNQEVIWHENNNGNGDFSEALYSPTTVGLAYFDNHGFADDFDNDGDLDIVLSLLDTVRYFENNSSALLQIINTELTVIDCYNGEISVEATGGEAPYLYRINDADFQTSNVFDIVMGDTITLFLQDATGNIINSPVTYLPPPNLPELDITVIGMDATIETIAGTPAFQYSIDGVNFQSDPAFLDLANGDYTITVIDDAGCLNTEPFTIDFTALSVENTVLTLQNCYQSELSIAANGGIAPYTYSIDNVDFQADSIFTVLAGSEVTGYIQDAGGTVIATDLIVVPEANLPILDAMVFNNSVTISANGGTPDFTYSLNGVNFVANNEFNNLENGDYTASVLDANGCLATIAFTINYAPPSIGEIAITPINCYETNVTVLAENGTAPYQFSLDGITFQTDSTFLLNAGDSFTVYVQDADNVVVSSSEMTLPSPDLPSLFPSVVGNTVSFSAFGGTGTYQYSLDSINFQSSNEFIDLANGIYTGYVIDELGCLATVDFLINVTSVFAMQNDFQFSISPNPTTGMVKLLLDNDLNGVWQAEVFNLTGQLLLQESFFKNTVQKTHAINLSAIPNGLLFVQLKHKMKTAVGRVLKVN